MKRENKTNLKLKDSKGITLIALVITINIEERLMDNHVLQIVQI